MTLEDGEERIVAERIAEVVALAAGAPRPASVSEPDPGQELSHPSLSQRSDERPAGVRPDFAGGH